MKKKPLPRLTLNRETIRRLDELQLGGLVGGDPPPSSQWICCPDP
ncbi:MAG TPA: class I lanthipeptide [Thermoanaerobaculia bacterium]|jgi:hypothetical protein|nr:class I lanthipeptide [Thermoanaerobaculia bacterium]